MGEIGLRFAGGRKKHNLDFMHLVGTYALGGYPCICLTSLSVMVDIIRNILSIVSVPTVDCYQDCSLSQFDVTVIVLATEILCDLHHVRTSFC